MSRIQNILEKAEREGAAMRTARVATPPSVVATPAPVVELPPLPAPEQPALAAPGALAQRATGAPSAAQAITPAVPTPSDTVPEFSVRLHPLLVAGLAPKSLAAEQYRTLRTRLAHTEGANALRTVLVTSPQKGEGKSLTSANLALTMAQELQRRVVLVEGDLRKPSLQHLFGL